MSTLKRKSNIALIVGILIIVLLIPIWYMMLAPSLITSELEKIDLETSYVGTFGNTGYIGTYSIINRSGVWEIPIKINAHAYATKVEGENVTLRTDVTMIREDYGEKLPDPFSTNLTYVFNKFTLENVEDSPEADKPREGHDPLYPSHLRNGENISNAWLENLNITATLEFKDSIVEQGLTLHKYFVNETLTKLLWIEDLEESRNCTLTSTKLLVLEPLSGLLAYTETETLDWIITHGTTELSFVYLTYRSTDEARSEGIATAKTAHDALQLLELYIPAILGVIALALAIVLVLNLRRLKR